MPIVSTQFPTFLTHSPLRLLLSAALVVGALVPSLAHARRCEGVGMRNTIEVDGQTLVLNGMGIREATVFSIDVFIAGLYLPEASSDGASIIASDSVKRLVLHFVRDVPTDGLSDGLADSFGPALASQVAQFARMLPAELVSGSRLVLTYLPGTGLVVHMGRRRVGVIRGQRFAQAFFRFMIGPNPPNSGLKVGLLGGHCG